MKLDTFDYENIRKKDNYAYVLLQSHLMKIDMETAPKHTKYNLKRLYS